MTHVAHLPSWLHRAARLLVGAAIAAAVYGCATDIAGPAADVVLVNGRIATVDQRFSFAEAVAVGGGRILAVGTSGDIRRMAGPGTRVVDLGGRTVVPGLIDNHTHVIRAAERWTQEARIDGVASRREALDIIAAKARAARPGEWVVVLGGWTEDQFTDQKGGFTREELDRAAPQNPVFMQVLFLRGYANSLALKASGMDGLPPERTRVLPPPSIRRMHETMPKVSQDAWRAGVRSLMGDLNRVGITAVLDVGGNGFTEQHYAPFAELDAKGGLSVRFIYLQYTEARTPDEGRAVAERLSREKPHRGSDYFRVIGIGENIYSPTTDNTYQPFKPSAPAAQAWGDIVRAAARGGWHVHQHATHDSTIAMFLDQIEAVDRDIPVRPLRWTLAHVDGISDSSVERLRRLGMGVTVHSRPSIQGQMVLKRWGDAGRNMPDLRRIQDSGLPWGLGTDTTVVAPYSPFVSLWWAVSGRMLDGSKVSDRTITRQEALVAHTRSNAWFLFEEKSLGSLEAGKHADLVVLDRDYFTVPEDEIRNIRPVMTMVGGRIVYEATGR
jgi:predicted amidohydrolase YtcJ